MPWGHIETDPSTSANFVTRSREYPKDSSSVVRSLIGLFDFRNKPVSREDQPTNVYQHRRGDGEKRQKWI